MKVSKMGKIIIQLSEDEVRIKNDFLALLDQILDDNEFSSNKNFEKFLLFLRSGVLNDNISEIEGSGRFISLNNELNLMVEMCEKYKRYLELHDAYVEILRGKPPKANFDQI